MFGSDEYNDEEHLRGKFLEEFGGKFKGFDLFLWLFYKILGFFCLDWVGEK